MIKPVNNQVLIEVIDQYAGLSHTGGDDQVGIVRRVSFSKEHLTASAGHTIYDPEEYYAWVQDLKNKTVRYALYADSDSTKFTQDSKNYVLIPWYRILGVEDGK